MLRSEFDKDLKRLADELIVEVSGFGAQSRELSMAIARLDEARHWVYEHGLRTGTHLLIDKRHYAEQLAKTADVPIQAEG